MRREREGGRGGGEGVERKGVEEEGEIELKVREGGWEGAAVAPAPVPALAAGLARTRRR